MTNSGLFEEIYAKYFPKVYAYFNVIFGSQQAEDLAAEVFTKLWRVCPDAPDNIVAYIFRVAVNVKNDFLREKYRKPEQAELSEADSYEVTAAAPFESIDLKTALNSLPHETRDLLLLSAYGLKSAELGKALGISASAARSRLAAARGKLKTVLG